MGHDIVPICNHKLDITNIHNLAHDLANRLNINITFVYYAEEAYNKILGINQKETMIVLGEVIKGINLKSYTLCDNNYQTKQIAEKFGLDYFRTEEYLSFIYGKMPQKTTIDLEIAEAQSVDYDLQYDGEGDSESAYITDKHFTNHFHYISRWWAFCKYFLQDYSYETEPVIEFRKNLLKDMIAIGGSKMYYLDDQGHTMPNAEMKKTPNEFIYDDSIKTWEDFESNLNLCPKHLQLDIPEYFLNENFRTIFIDRNKYPLLFVDDFRDL